MCVVTVSCNLLLSFIVLFHVFCECLIVTCFCYVFSVRSDGVLRRESRHAFTVPTSVCSHNASGHSSPRDLLTAWTPFRRLVLLNIQPVSVHSSHIDGRRKLNRWTWCGSTYSFRNTPAHEFCESLLVQKASGLSVRAATVSSGVGATDYPVFGTIPANTPK